MARLTKINSFSNQKFVANGTYCTRIPSTTLKIWSTFSDTLKYQSQDGSITTDFSEPFGGTLTFPSDTPLLTNFFAKNPTRSLETQNNTTSAQIAFSDTEKTSFSNKPFTIMFWMKASSATYQTVLSLGATYIAVGVNGSTGPGGSATIRLTADFSGVDGVFLSDVSNVLSTCQNTWVHICVSYDPRSTSNVPKFYVNGEPLGANVSTPPTGGGMLIVSSLNLGSDAGSGTTRFSNYMQFNNFVTRDEDVKSLYNASLFQAFKPGSGFISNPPRVLIREKDCLTGSYPTIARTGDTDFTGIYRSFYNDVSTINFVASDSTTYPSVLPSNSMWVSGDIATPNVLQGLTTNGAALKGVSDAHVSFTPGQNIRAFDESRVYIDNDSAFFQTGTDSDIVPFFDQRLSSKTIIKLRFNNTQEKKLYYTTGTFNRFLDQTFTMGAYTYNSQADLYSQWRLDTPVRSGSDWLYAGNNGAINVTGSSNGNFWTSPLNIVNKESTVSYVRPYDNNFYAASTKFSGSLVAPNGYGRIDTTDLGFNFDNNFSISFWIKFDKVDSFSSKNRDIFDEVTILWSSFNLGYEAGIDTQGRIRFLAWMTDNSAREFKTETNFIRTGSWYFLTFSYNESASPKLNIFKNGEAATITTVTAGTATDWGMYPGNRFTVTTGDSSWLGVNTSSGSVGNWVDLSIHAKAIDVSNHIAMYRAAQSSNQASNTGLAYMDFENSRWTIIGEGSSFDYTSPLPEIATGSYLAFAPQYPNATAGVVGNIRDSRLISRIIGSPTDLCGFPHDSKFNPTRSQLFSLSGSLTAPFLVEKIVYKFSGSLPPTIAGTDCTQIFLMSPGRETYSLNQTPELTQIVSGGIFVPGILQNPTDKQQSYTSISRINQNNSLIDVAMIARGSTLSDGQRRDLNIESSSPVTGTFIVPSRVKVFGASGFVGLKTNRLIGAAGPGHGSLWLGSGIGKSAYFSANSVGILRNQYGGRDGLGIATSDGRSFVKSVVGSQVSGSLSVNYLPDPNDSFSQAQTYISNNTYNYNVPVYSVVTSSAPYILLPGDQICLGINYNPLQVVESFGAAAGLSYEHIIGDPGRALVLAPGSVEVTLYGSLLQANKPVDSVINQPLTSDAVHESLHYDNIVLDQFDVEPFAALTGSYVDLIITGSMLAASIGNPFAKNVRKVQASCAAGQAGSTGSLQRFIKLTAGSYYDQKKNLFNFNPIFDSQPVNFTGSDGTVFLSSISTYGLTDARSKFPQSSVRRDRYGQFRDTFEQMPVYYMGPSLEGDRPVEIVFYSRTGKDGKGNFIVDDPTQTHSQNLSKFSTSSLPYYDRGKNDVGVDRPDNPDNSLKYIDITFPTLP